MRNIKILTKTVNLMIKKQKKKRMERVILGQPGWPCAMLSSLSPENPPQRQPQGPKSRCCTSPIPLWLPHSLPLTLSNAGGPLFFLLSPCLSPDMSLPSGIWPLGNFPEDSSTSAPLQVPAPASGLSSNTWEVWSCQKETEPVPRVVYWLGSSILSLHNFLCEEEKK